MAESFIASSVSAQSSSSGISFTQELFSEEFIIGDYEMNENTTFTLPMSTDWPSFLAIKIEIDWTPSSSTNISGYYMLSAASIIGNMGTLYGDSIPTNGYKILGMNYVIWNPKINRDIDNAILSYGTLALLNGSGTIAGHQLSELSLDINFNYSYWFGGTHQARITILC